MDRRFDNELTELNNKILKMAAITQDAIHEAIESVKHRDKEQAEHVIQCDCVIDQYELDIEEYTIDLLVRRQPIAGDLRLITTGMKLNTELERIADLAVNIAHRSIDLADQPTLKPLVDTQELTEVAICMVRESIDSFVSRDVELAKKVIKNDKKANELRTQIHKDLIDNYITKDIKTLSRALSLFLVAQHLERICDHAKYIAEDVIYLVRAKTIKHHHKEEIG